MMLVALGVCVLEEHTKAGVVIADTDTINDTVLHSVRSVPGVLSVAVEAARASPPATALRATLNSSPYNGSSRSRPYAVRTG
jgi:hypothetical protein